MNIVRMRMLNDKITYQGFIYLDSHNVWMFRYYSSIFGWMSRPLSDFCPA